MGPRRFSDDEIPDRELVAAAQAGDKDALEVLLRRHHDRIRAVASRLTGNHADAADATQEALIAVARGINRFDGRSQFSTWVYRVATNACLDELRRRRRRPVPTEEEFRTDTPVAARDTAAVNRMIVDAALATLSDEFRVPVVLRDLADLDYAEIADVLDIPVGTVKSRIARGRMQLAQALGNSPPPSVRPTTIGDDSTGHGI